MRDAFPWLMFVLGAFLVLFLVLAAVEDQREWETFAATHECRVVGQMRGSTGTGVGPIIGGSGGVAVTSTYIPGKTGYACNDGVTYWR